MAFKQVQFGDSAFGLRFEFPPHWDASSITGVTVKITDTGGTDLLAATAATLYSSVALGSAASRGAGELTLTGTPGALVRGDRLLIANSNDGDAEEIEVANYNTSTKVITLRHLLQDAHSSGADLYPLWATYSLDASDSDTFPANKKFSITWTPDTDDIPATEMAVIGKMEFASSETIDRFRAQYPTYYEVRTPTQISELEVEARKRVGHWCRSKNLDLNRVKDQDLLTPAVIEMLAFLVASGGGDAWAYETSTAWDNFQREFDTVASFPIWQDTDQDDVQDDAEVQTHLVPYFHRGI